jgi:hypothetical protein
MARAEAVGKECGVIRQVGVIVALEMQIPFRWRTV